MKISTARIAQSAIFIAIGIILPVLFHLFGLGKEFLPMHIPVILGGILLGWKMGLIIGILTPLMSSLATGMPPMMPPVAVAMMIELAILGTLSGALYPLFRENVIATLLVAILAGRVAWGVIGYFMLPLLGISGVSILYPLGIGLVASLPGLVVQIVLIPLLVGALKKRV
ncbi:MAG: ECF transporter S component [Vulcanimicrobiota bacterium]